VGSMKLQIGVGSSEQGRGDEMCVSGFRNGVESGKGVRCGCLKGVTECTFH
jgi:hypothetical protein